MSRKAPEYVPCSTVGKYNFNKNSFFFCRIVLHVRTLFIKKKKKKKRRLTGDFTFNFF